MFPFSSYFWRSFCAKVPAGFKTYYALFNQVTKSHVMNNVGLTIYEEFLNSQSLVAVGYITALLFGTVVAV